MVASPRIDKLLALLLLGAACLPVGARSLQVRIDEVGAPAVTLRGVTVTLAWPEGAKEGQLAVQAEDLRFADSGYRFKALRWTCPLERDASRWHCAGAIAAAAGKGRLAASVDGDHAEAKFSRGGASLALSSPGDGGNWPVTAESVPAAWLEPLLSRLWPEARFTAGTFDAELQLDPSSADALQLRGTLATNALGLDTADGRIAAADLTLKGPLALRLGDSTQVEIDFAIAGGELLAGPVYAALPATGLRLQLNAEGSGSHWTLPRLRWNDAAALDVEGELQLDLSADAVLREAKLRIASPDLALATTRYLATLLGAAGLAELSLAGAADATVTIDSAQVQRFHAQLQAVDAIDAAGRFAVHDAEGSIGWTRGSPHLAGELRGREAALYGLPLGPAKLAWRSGGGELALRSPTTLTLLGGSLTLDQLAWSPAGPEGNTELAVSMQLAGVDLGDLGARFGWPEFGGTLSGRIPSAHYENGVLTLAGGLEMGMFDGRVVVDTLTLERPFGVAPTLGADITLHNLDLVPLTGAFGFGQISGRLDGRIADLRMVDWEPVAFDALFLTSTNAPDKRRISQRAVSDLSSVGGSGLAGGIQQRVLRMFETFPYARIGLSCRLENNLCLMGGIPGSDSSGSGYTIVEGSGLPHITVVGHQRRVDWPVLVARLQTATAGQAPIVD